MQIKEIKNKIIQSLFGRREDVGKRMRYSVIMLISYRNIAANKFRSVLTIGGVAIGIAIITFLISIGFGVQQMVIEAITKSNPISIIDIKNDNLENFIVISDEMMDKIKNIEGVARIERLEELGGKFYNNDSKVDSVLLGVSKGYLELAQLKLSYGSLDYADNEAYLLITPKLAMLLGFENPADVIGKELEYETIISKEIVNKELKIEKPGREKIKIVGVIEDSANNNNSIYAYTMAEHLKNKFGVNAGQSGKVEVKSGSNLEDIRSKIEQLGLTTESVSDTIVSVEAFFGIVSIVMVVFGTIIMSISAMGMLNTLSVSLLQRTREVGILKALGAKRADVFKMFILEAIIISFSGGAIGILSGFGFAKLINWTFNHFAYKRGAQISDFIEMPYYFLISIGVFIVVLGLVTGIMPARRASVTHALDALRYE